MAVMIDSAHSTKHITSLQMVLPNTRRLFLRSAVRGKKRRAYVSVCKRFIAPLFSNQSDVVFIRIIFRARIVCNAVFIGEG